MFNKNIIPLSNEINDKYEKYLNDSSFLENSKYFSYEEFCEVFEKRNLHSEFSYNDKIIVITNDMPKYYFTIEDTEFEPGVSKIYTSTRELFINSRIDEKTFEEIWLNLLICK